MQGETYAIAPAASLPVIGCKRDAVAAVKGDLRELGHGAMRVAFTNARGDVVYKLTRRGREVGDPSRNEDNESEYLSLLHYRTKGHTWASGCALYYVDPRTMTVVATSNGTSELPPTDVRSRCTAVLAMRAYHRSGDEDAVARSYRRHVPGRGVFLPDMHPGNYRGTRTGRVRVTDLGRVRL